MLGAQRLNVVSGNVVTEIAGADLELKSVSGDVKVRGHGQSARLYVSTVSGDVHLEHGAGDLEMSSVSGTLGVTLDSAHSVRARTTSGDLRFEGKLTRDASFEATSVSGDLKVRAPAEGGYSYDLSSFSGDIEQLLRRHERQERRRGALPVRDPGRGRRARAPEDHERRHRALRPHLSFPRKPRRTARRRCASRHGAPGGGRLESPPA